MVCRYPRRTWSILAGMIITGAARSIAVKLAYQSGLRAPLTITLLYLLGQSLSLVVYWISSRTTTDCVGAPTTEGIELRASRCRPVDDDDDDNFGPLGDPADQDERAGIASADDDRDCDDRATVLARSFSPTTDVAPPPPHPSKLHPTTPSYDSAKSWSSSSSSSSSHSAIARLCSSLRDCYHDGDDGNVIPNGSRHGLSDESEEWTHRKSRVVPHHARPMIPAFLNLLNSGL